ncbi:DUF6279 family lipoprotein [Alteromonas sp. C1M14]|uniref:DUF6279 family lipoprotein n=1 Tax=Alteromonas sp. C1M14 TaxID=2841567 RepID=UPI001C08CDC8|nr:DUF6279 family lipoprotein [Alteromonas sp. C1M14]MBU2976934.1 hypothetical protein [Alteromonas sp. C1M14]
MKKYVVMALVVLLAGCSSKLAYNNIDWLVYWYMDDYIELDNQQEAIFDAQLGRWIDWHRSEELPKYIDHLKQVRNDVAQSRLSERRLLAHYELAKEHWDRFRREISPPLVDIATSLSDEQVIHLFAALEAENKEREEKIAKRHGLPAQAQMDKRIEGIVDDMESRIGSLTAQQQQIVMDYAPSFRSSSQLWLDYRRDLQQRARRLFATRNSRDDFATNLLALLMDPEQYRSEEFVTVWKQNSLAQARLAADIAKTLTEQQQQKLLNDIDEMIDDLTALTEQ